MDANDGEHWYFPYGQWLADNEGDKQISREINAIKEDISTYSPLISYSIDVLTGDRSGAGTDANVSIELIGDNGKSGLHVLDNAQNNFERNKTDSFGIQCPDLGKLQRISIGHDNSGFGAAWFLDKIIIANQKSGEKAYFLSGDWFDGSNNRKEIAASDIDGNCVQPLTSYKIEVVTGDPWY